MLDVATGLEKNERIEIDPRGKISNGVEGCSGEKRSDWEVVISFPEIWETLE